MRSHRVATQGLTGRTARSGDAPSSTVTAREAQVLRAVLEHPTRKEAGASLGLTAQRVTNVMSIVGRRLEVDARDAAKAARRAGLLDTPV